MRTSQILGFSVLFYVFGFSFFSFSYLFAAVAGLLLGLLLAKELSRKNNPAAEFLPWVMDVNFPWTFSLQFLCIFVRISGTLIQSLRSGYYWKDLFLLQILSVMMPLLA